MNPLTCLFHKARQFKSLFVAMLILFSLSAQAHHAGTAFSRERGNISGVVKEFHFVNPHTFIYVDVTEADGSVVTYKFEGQSVSVLARSGWRKDTLKPGDKVSLSYSPYVDPERKGGEYHNVTLEDGTVMGMERI